MKTKYVPFVIAVIIIATYPILCGAKELGVIGKVYPIKEKDMLEVIQERLQEKKASGELDRINDELLKQARHKTMRPPPVEGITKTTEPSTHYYDPTMVLKKDIFDAENHLIYAKGTTINPLDIKGLTRNILFFDGDDKEQVSWAKKLTGYYEGRVKLILVKGPISDLMKQLNMQLFFDQKGVLVKRFRIEHVPAIVSQENRLLRIDEVTP